ncbi:hypothetical protein NDU88_006591 [Pleurodeles waltl]|uniref:Uncharacterized protein n=1 Tax=Pleurodeles waltl TaxID=8319 RepID=A0AAV7N7Q5_PLEWA|nr:hypothetical protein NDU88_006591 [Pleurodeles waltl]
MDPSGPDEEESSCRGAGGTPETTTPEGTEATLQKILEAIEESKNTLRQEIGKVSTELSHLWADHRKLSDRVKTTEEELTRLGTQQQSHETQIAHITDKVQRLEYQAEDVEGTVTAIMNAL